MALRVAAHGAPQLRWLGDGLLSVFGSTADAVRCAVALQHAARRRAAGERLSIRIGLHVAPAMRDETEPVGYQGVSNGGTFCSARQL